MKLTKKQLLGVNITVNTKEDILSVIAEYLHEGSDAVKKSPFVVVTPNPEQVVLAKNDNEFLRLLNRADVAIPDGIGLVWAMKFMKHVVLTRISGIDFFSDLVRLANKHDYVIGLIGGQNGVGKKALAELTSSYTHLSGWAIEPEEMSDEKLAGHIVDSNTNIVFVGLGAPKQEQYIEAVKKHCKRVVFMSVGGAFDMISGSIPRAPVWMQQSGLEWIYRLCKEPWRWKRQLAIISFLSLVFQEKFFHTKTVQ